MEWPAPPSGDVRSPAFSGGGMGMRMRISVLGVDLGKNVCSLVGFDASGAVVLRRRAKRETLIALAAKLPPCVVAMEACCGAHHLGRVFAAHGHDVRLMSPEYVRPYVKAQKNDDRDAEGVAEAATRPTVARHSAGERVGRAAGQVEAQGVPERADGQARRSELEPTHDPARRGRPRAMGGARSTDRSLRC